MTLVRRARNLARRAIYPVLPRGTDLFLDVARHLPELAVEVVFDVGANTGQSARDFLAWFPRSRVYCFEPVGETFRRLRAGLPDGGRVRSFPLALGAAPGEGKMAHRGMSEMFRLVDAVDADQLDGAAPLEDVRVSTVDEFCRSQGLDHIGYLKIDTEGSDLDVLRGGEEMLAAQRVDLVQVEAGMNPGNETHVPLERLKEFLEARGYLLFGVYEQVPEWPTRQPHLRRSNCLFVAGSAIPPPAR